MCGKRHLKRLTMPLENRTGRTYPGDSLDQLEVDIVVHGLYSTSWQ